MSTTEGPRERHEAIIDGAVFATIKINCTGLIEDVDPADDRMFGCQAADIIGRNVGV